MNSELNIAFLTSQDPNNRKSWSGIYFHMFKSLKKQFTNVIPLGPVRLNMFLYLLTKLSNLGNRFFFTRHYDISRSKILARYYAAIFDKKLRGGQFDIIFAPASSVEIAYIKTDLPIFYFSDTSVNQIKDYYNTFSRLSKYSDKETELIQSRALKNSQIVIHASKWATDHVIKHYGVNKEISYTIGFGANIDNAPELQIIESKIANKTTCNLLLLGVDWERKGGAIAFETMVELDKLGLDVNLVICGCTPPKKFNHKKMKVIPFLDKNKEDDYNQFLQLMKQTHFLILPTRAECSAIVYAEASAYGIPSITTDTGGVSSMVENNVNGFMLPLKANATDYANLIKRIFDDQNTYQKLVYSSRAKYDHELNWMHWGVRIKEVILDNYKDKL